MTVRVALSGAGVMGAFPDPASSSQAFPDALGVRPQVPCASAAHSALDDVSRTIGGLRPIVDHPVFRQTAHWLCKAEVVWVAGSMPGDALAVACIIEGLQRQGLVVRSGLMTRMAQETYALGGKPRADSRGACIGIASRERLLVDGDGGRGSPHRPGPLTPARHLALRNDDRTGYRREQRTAGAAGRRRAARRLGRRHAPARESSGLLIVSSEPMFRRAAGTSC